MAKKTKQAAAKRVKKTTRKTAAGGPGKKLTRKQAKRAAAVEAADAAPRCDCSALVVPHTHTASGPVALEP